MRHELRAVVKSKHIFDAVLYTFCCWWGSNVGVRSPLKRETRPMPWRLTLGHVLVLPRGQREPRFVGSGKALTKLQSRDGPVQPHCNNTTVYLLAALRASSRCRRRVAGERRVPLCNGRLLVMITEPCSYRCAMTWKRWLASSRENGRYPSSQITSSFGAWIDLRVYSLSRPWRYAEASCSMSSAAETNRVLIPDCVALQPIEIAKWVLPTPVGPSSTTFSARFDKRKRCELVEDGFRSACRKGEVVLFKRFDRWKAGGLRQLNAAALLALA